MIGETVRLTAADVALQAWLAQPPEPRGVVVFAHGSGSSRHRPRNRQVAEGLREAGFATLLLDLLTTDEERVDALTGHFRFDIPVLAERLVGATEWVAGAPALLGLPIGYFGASTGAAAALVAAAARPVQVAAVVSQGGRPDLAGAALARVRAPTLLIVGGHDHPVLALNRQARARMTGPTRLETVSGAGHLFEEPGALEAVARLALGWFEEHFPAGRSEVRPAG